MLLPMLNGPVATVDLAALGHNLASIRAAARGAPVMAAIKADGYGHGAVAVARALVDQGVRWFGVATPEEAITLREAGVTGGILVFSPVHHGHSLRRLVAAGVSLTVPDEEALRSLQAAQTQGTAHVHLKVDTGMGRLGRPWQEAPSLARAIEGTDGVELEGVWTHFARSDERDPDATDRQLEAFEAALGALRRDGIEAGIRHASNSAAIFLHPAARYDMVRPGIALYGYHASDVVEAAAPRLAPVMRLDAPVTFVKRVEAGTAISYDGQWRAAAPTTVATVRFGYADGYPRQLSGKGWASVNGATVRLAGRVCMDQMMFDVGELEVLPGDVVTLFGGPGPDAEALARAAGTISYELFTRITGRVTRRYRSAGDEG